MSEVAERVPVRTVLGLAVPALGVLAAEPLYVLVDTAVIGHLGAVPLAGLALGGTLFTLVSSQLTFLSYGTTARTARLHGAGRRKDAVAEGVQATWLGIAVGVLLLVLAQLFAVPVAELLAGEGPIADAAASWLRIALLGAPLVLITMAGNGWMRGVQDTRRPLWFVLAGNGTSAVLCPLFVYPLGWGLEGSAVANLIGQSIAAALFLRALVVERAGMRPDPATMRAQLGMGRDLVLRTLAFQACFLSATSVAARTGADAAAAHQVVWQLWSFLALVLDSLAIAAQSLVGAALGGGAAQRAKGVARQVSWYGLGFGVLLGLVFAALAAVLPRVFTSDAAVLAQLPNAWWFFVLQQPVAGVVFALDGVFLGAGDARYLRTATMLSAAVGYLPLIWLSLAFGWGLAGIWTGLSLFMVLRLITLLLRARSGKWAVVGAAPA
ncbi:MULTISPECIES: MATE family efflux transporter [Saccharopolyspora]|uniref:MATE family efflux transporter n=1 Tax=Saccharopolyspora gregorii TaxID=33914 RepID=A0ABP6RMT9_9PSEU|nr:MULTISPECIES: MATE family efflux transporter [Saccharopolyspora]MCA1186867.1 MATE family efflux transporter [Saccharopolyspora sp. 6T]MCA1193370.1 MATE family efflux transporter [Saccharopolyspora sp. 6V]MCA1228323.1 MATE family efflux transporter [Saccharopolyspora sp. 6M]MCA1282089.1 MATE family efflux transporter [Saccharopolyspora sp. 7B]